MAVVIKNTAEEFARRAVEARMAFMCVGDHQGLLTAVMDNTTVHLQWDRRNLRVVQTAKKQEVARVTGQHHRCRTSRDWEHPDAGSKGVVGRRLHAGAQREITLAVVWEVPCTLFSGIEDIEVARSSQMARCVLGVGVQFARRTMLLDDHL